LIECQAERYDDGGVLHITITDYGCGIQDVEEAVVPFFTTLADGERSGMGFTIMQTFMSEFSLQSEYGKGTTVRMSKKIGAEKEEIKERMDA
jgi:stage II sporulation protein AB (anti-sigma F factor)